MPLAVSHPPAELTYYVEDSGASVVVAPPKWRTGCAPSPRARPAVPADHRPADRWRREAVLPALTPDRRAMILYTSGTTSRPKGVVSTHWNVQARVTTLVDAWGWQQADHILLVLPLHHVHGIINVLTCALWSEPE